MRAPQLVSCRERRTGISVILVGAMHHNSHSIRLAERAVADAAASGSLRAVLVESCPTRWNTTLASRGSWLARHCPDEMYAAAVAAAAVPDTYMRPLTAPPPLETSSGRLSDRSAVRLSRFALCDQRIQLTGRRVSQLASVAGDESWPQRECPAKFWPRLII